MSGVIGTSHSKSKVIGKSLDTAKVWINFNGTGTIAIQDSFNVSSIADDGATGQYTVNFDTPMANADYCLMFSPNDQANSAATLIDEQNWSPTTTYCSFSTGYVSGTGGQGTNMDIREIHMCIFGA